MRFGNLNLIGVRKQCAAVLKSFFFQIFQGIKAFKNARVSGRECGGGLFSV